MIDPVAATFFFASVAPFGSTIGMLRARRRRSSFVERVSFAAAVPSRD